jgi:hypothetical protein
VPRGKERKFSEADIRRFDEENKRLKEEVLRGVDTEDLKRRDRQSGLLSEIKQRQVAAAA